MSPLVIGEILPVFVDTLTAAGKYFLQECAILHPLVEMPLSEK